MSLGFTEMLSIGASVLGGRSGGGVQQIEAPDVNFTRFMMTTESPEQAQTVKFGQTSAQYTEFLQAWDSYLNNEYLEMSKRIM